MKRRVQRVPRQEELVEWVEDTVCLADLCMACPLTVFSFLFKCPLLGPLPLNSFLCTC